jgi:arylsulfatase A-like enzyme
LTSSNKKENILVIITDTQRCDTLAFMGNPHAVSPNLDRLAREGVYFTQSHTSSPVCMPARCSFLTGVHTPIHGCIENGFQRKERLAVLPDLLKQQGYTNIMVGKTHFGPIPKSFDIRHLTYEKPMLVEDAYTEHLRRHGFDRTKDHRHPTPIPEDVHMESYLIDHTIREIERVVADKRTPFFAICSLFSPHSPVDPPGKWASLYDNITLPEINYMSGEEKSLPPTIKKLLGLVENKEAATPKSDIDLSYFNEAMGRTFDPAHLDSINNLRRLYYSLTAYCDAQIGRLIDFIDRAGLREETLIIFSSDHGQQYYDHGFNDKHCYYDASWRVPLIMSLPGTLRQGMVRDFAIWNDLPATILAVAGISYAPIQGFDLFSPLTRDEISPRRCAVGTLFTSCALATKCWKLEYYFGDGQGRLFDRRKDSTEQDNLYDSLDHKEVRDTLLTALLTWRAEIMDWQHLTEGKFRLVGPVAMRARSLVSSIRGADAEQRLNEKAEQIDEQSKTGA